MNKFLLLLLLSVSLLFSCNNDDEKEDDMNNSVNITTQLLGIYSGTSKFEEDGSFLTEDNRTATSTMSSDSVVNISINSAFSSAFNLVAKLNTETTFTVEGATILGDGPYVGSGNLNGETLTIQLAVNSLMYEFVGTK